MNEKRFKHGLDRLRAPERVAMLEVEQVVKFCCGDIVVNSVLDVGTGTGILIHLIQQYLPKQIYACDLSKKMLKQLRKNYSDVETILSDIRDLTMQDANIDVVFINACYPNIADKPGAFINLARIMKPAGRMIISHPLGKEFVDVLKKNAPYPLDNFPGESEAKLLIAPYGFDIQSFVDEPELYILTAVKQS